MLGIPWSRRYRVNRSYETFLRGGVQAENNADIASGVAKPHEVRILDRAYLTFGQPSTVRTRTGRLENRPSGFPIQSFVTASPGNKQRSRTGPIHTRDVIADILEGKRSSSGVSNAGQSAFT